MMSLNAYLLVAVLLFSLGLYAVMARRNVIAMLIGLELMLNASSLSFLAFNRFVAVDPSVGRIVVLFIIGLAAAEVSIALAIMVAAYRQRKRIDVDDLEELRG